MSTITKDRCYILRSSGCLRCVLLTLYFLKQTCYRGTVITSVLLTVFVRQHILGFVLGFSDHSKLNYFSLHSQVSPPSKFIKLKHKLGFIKIKSFPINGALLKKILCISQVSELGSNPDLRCEILCKYSEILFNWTST